MQRNNSSPFSEDVDKMYRENSGKTFSAAFFICKSRLTEPTTNSFCFYLQVPFGVLKLKVTQTITLWNAELLFFFVCLFVFLK